METQGRLTSLRDEITRDISQLLQSNPTPTAFIYPVVAIPSLEPVTDQAQQSEERLTHLCQSIETLSSTARLAQAEQVILGQLYFPSMEQRVEAISKPGG